MTQQRPHGTDCSSWQGKIDFQKMAAKVDFTILRAAYGSIADNYIGVNWVGSKAAGIPRGAYLYYYPPYIASPIHQARALVDALKGDRGELPLTIDVETPAQAWTNEWRDALQTCIAEVERLDGRKPMIYTGTWFMPYVGNAPWLAAHHLWLGMYVSENKITVPKPWSKWTIWQYTSSGRGADYGVASANIDLDTMAVPLSTLMNKPVETPRTVRITSVAGTIDVPLPFEVSDATV